MAATREATRRIVRSLPLAAALYSAAEQRRLRWSAAIALMAAGISWGDGARSRWEAAQRSIRLLQATADQERILAQAIAATERAEIARELHDTPGHQATVISMQADMATEALARDRPMAPRSLEIIGATSRQMMQDLRETVRTLREHEVRPARVSIAALEKSVFPDSTLTIHAEITVGGGRLRTVRNHSTR